MIEGIFSLIGGHSHKFYYLIKMDGKLIWFRGVEPEVYKVTHFSPAKLGLRTQTST